MKMNINQLLEKYWNAEASLQEEAELRAYFSSDDVAPEHEQFKKLFTFFSIGRLQSTDLDVEEVLSSLSSIDLILEKYWNAETSVEEEAQLREYFSNDSVAPEHLQYRDLFTFYEVSKSQTSNLDLNALFNENSNIDELLEKYWNTETSVEEENTLRSYFANDDLDEKHEVYRGMFDLFRTQTSATTDLDIRDILSKAEAETEADNGERAIGSPTMPRAAKSNVFSLQKWAVGLAAIFILGFAAVSLMNQDTGSQYKGHATVLDEEAEAQEAYEITKQALAFLSKNMNKGSETIVESVAKAEKVSIFK